VKLLADSMLGSLGRWLRLLGYDTVTAQHEPDAVLVRWARAEDRIVLTRDQHLANQRGIEALLITSDNLDEQLLQVARQLPLPPPRPGTRCPRCNAPLHEASNSAVEESVPSYVLHTQSAFQRCRGCQRVYWRGTHWASIAAKARLIETGRGGK
jgi:uncharacterized protein with PIN domain